MPEYPPVPGMRLVDILSCLDIGGSPPSKAASLLRAYLASLLHAMRCRHLKDDMAIDFITLVKGKWLSLPGSHPHPDRPGEADFSEQSIDGIWSTFQELLISFEGSKCLQHCGILNCGGGALEDPVDVPLVSIQDDRAFQFWLRDSVPEVRYDEKGAADILALIDACKTREALSEASVGRPNSVVWLTPKSGEVGALMNQAQHMMETHQGAVLESMSIADKVRNRLGLWESDSSRHGIAVILKRSYSDLVDDRAARLKAPTIFDAEGYARFRHWPSPTRSPSDPMGRGRTYELDPAIRVHHRPRDGAPEIIAPPRPFDEVESIIYLGRYGTPPGKGDTTSELEVCAQFADAVAGLENSLHTIVRELAARLPV